MKWHLADYNQNRRSRLEDNIKMGLEYIGWFENWLCWCGPGHGHMAGPCEAELTCWFHKMGKIYWLAEVLLDSQVGLYSTKVVSRSWHRIVGLFVSAITDAQVECARKEGYDVCLLIWSNAPSSSFEHPCVYCPNISSTLRTAIQYI